MFQTLATNFFETISVLANISTDFDPICPIMICWKLVLKKPNIKLFTKTHVAALLTPTTQQHRKIQLLLLNPQCTIFCARPKASYIK